jgi:uncharacterized protein (UPF0276 family)
MQAAASLIPARAGIGLRAPHYRDMRSRRPALAFLEVHSENYFGAGGPPHAHLESLRADYPLSLHGVGLSLGSRDALDHVHLARLKALIVRYQPALVSEHLCWASAGGVHTHDLLPLPYNDETVRLVASHVRQTQETLERQILIENVSAYVEFADSNLSEWEFVRAVLDEADCGLLLDINNLYVNAINHSFDPLAYLAAMPAERIGEYHLAGFDRDDHLDCLVDTHGKPVHAPVWALYRAALAQFGARPTLIEWDTDIPPLDTLLAEAARADELIAEASHASTVAA